MAEPASSSSSSSSNAARSASMTAFRENLRKGRLASAAASTSPSSSSSNNPTAAATLAAASVAAVIPAPIFAAASSFGNMLLGTSSSSSGRSAAAAPKPRRKRSTASTVPLPVAAADSVAEEVMERDETKEQERDVIVDVVPPSLAPPAVPVAEAEETSVDDGDGWNLDEEVEEEVALPPPLVELENEIIPESHPPASVLVEAVAADAPSLIDLKSVYEPDMASAASDIDSPITASTATTIVSDLIDIDSSIISPSPTIPPVSATIPNHSDISEVLRDDPASLVPLPSSTSLIDIEADSKPSPTPSRSTPSIELSSLSLIPSDTPSSILASTSSSEAVSPIAVEEETVDLVSTVEIEKDEMEAISTSNEPVTDQQQLIDDVLIVESDPRENEVPGEEVGDEKEITILELAVDPTIVVDPVAEVVDISPTALASSSSTLLPCKDSRLTEISTAYKRLQRLKSNLDRVVSNILPVVSSVSDIESFERELRNLSSKSEMSMEEVRRLSNEAIAHKATMLELRDTHQLQIKAHSGTIDTLSKQLELKDSALRLLTSKLAAAEESIKANQLELTTSQEEYAKMKIIAKEEEEKRVKALSLLRALRQKLVKSDKDRDEGNLSTEQLRQAESNALDQVRSERARFEKEFATARMVQDAQLVKLRNSFERESSAIKGQYERETSVRKGQYELEAITTKAGYSKEIANRENRIHQLEGTVRELTLSRDTTFDSLQLRMAESESSLDQSRTVQMELVELRYTLKEMEDRSAAVVEELEELKRTQKDSTRDDANLRRSLAEAEARYEARARDLLSKIAELESDRQATELEMSITLSERNKELDKVRKEMVVKESEWKESLGERKQRESVIESGEREKKELREKIRGLDMLAIELRAEVEKSTQQELALQETLIDRVQRATELESRLEETQLKESALRSNNKMLREELRKVQSGVLLSEKKRNPGVGYFAALSQQQQQQQHQQQSQQHLSSQQTTQFHSSSYPSTSSPTSLRSSRASLLRSDSFDSGKSPVSPISRSGSINSFSMVDLDPVPEAEIGQRRSSMDSNMSGMTEGPSFRDLRDSKDREDEAVNFEYLRNVLLEFLEKPAMRPQLIGVMGVILRFTPSEARRLSAKVGL